MNLVLFALTGIGNEVLRALEHEGIRPSLVVSRSETGSFPYYAERQLTVEANSMGIPLLFDQEGEEEAVRLTPDLLLSATYHRLIPQRVLDAAGDAFNIHPSLLPAYPGKNPFYWALINGETETGVTVHRLTEKFDTGDIVLQRSVGIAPNETQGSLRRKLAGLSGEVTRQIVTTCETGSLFSHPNLATQVKHCGQVMGADRILNLHGTYDALSRQIRALAPWPRAIIGQNGFEVIALVEVQKMVPQPENIGQIRFLESSIAQVELVDAMVTLRVGTNATIGQVIS